MIDNTVERIIDDINGLNEEADSFWRNRTYESGKRENRQY